jgi:competence protein ComEC
MKQIIVFFSIAFIFLFIWYIQYAYVENVIVTFCDVGQGDAILISHKQTQILIDTGPSDSVVQCLESQLPLWDSTIEFLILTHMDADHIGGASAVLEHYFVKYIFMNPSDKKSTDFDGLQKVLSRRKDIVSRVVTTYVGQRVFVSNILSFQVITPQVDFTQVDAQKTSSSETTLSDESQGKLDNIFNKNTENDLSIGVKVSVGNIGIFLSGDLEEKGEVAVIKNSLLNSIDVLKVGHHGSKSSSSIGFIEVLRPEVSVISSGINNQYNHPNTQVLSILQKNNSNIFQTSNSGTIIFESDGQSFWEKP